MIRVLVVDDSLTVRARLVEVLGADPDLQVVGEAADGQRAIELCESLRPDVMTLDMMLPLVDGLAVTEHVMAYCPTPIIIVSSSTNRGEVFNTCEALAAGAVEVLDKPSIDEPPDAWGQRLVSLVKLVSRIKVITHPRGRLGQRARDQYLQSVRPRHEPPTPVPVRPTETGYRLVAIGTSTGGPRAVVDVLSRLPSSYPLPILLVIHIGRLFAAGFAEWLKGQSPVPVSVAGDGMPLPAPGEARVVMAPPDVHLVVDGGRLRLTHDPERHSCRPSVDVLFESLARELGPSAIACLLTGMGRDGAEGLRALERAGAMTIAQNEQTCTVYGMPREAIKIGAAKRVLPIEEIGPLLRQLGGR